MPHGRTPISSAPRAPRPVGTNRFSFDRIGVELEGGWECVPSRRETPADRRAVPRDQQWAGECDDAPLDRYWCQHAPGRYVEQEQLEQMHRWQTDNLLEEEDDGSLDFSGYCVHCTRNRLIQRRRMAAGRHSEPPGQSCACPRTYEHDGSVELHEEQSHNPNLNHIGEVRLGPVATLGEMRRLLAEHYPTAHNASCGMHVHMSFLSTMDYERLMTRELTEFVCDQLILWGQRMERKGLEIPNNFYARLRGENDRYCARSYQGGTQIETQGRGSRYTVFNYCFHKHGTLECRVLPMMPNAHLAYKAIEKMLSLVVTFLIQKTRRIKPLVLEGALSLAECEAAGAPKDSLDEGTGEITPPSFEDGLNLPDEGRLVYSMTEDMEFLDMQDRELQRPPADLRRPTSPSIEETMQLLGMTGDGFQRLTDAAQRTSLSWSDFVARWAMVSAATLRDLGPDITIEF